MAVRGNSEQIGGRGEKCLDSGSDKDNRICWQVGREIEKSQG